MKKIYAGLLCVMLLCTMTACSAGKGWVFSLNGEKLNEKEVTAFGMIYTKEHNITDSSELSKEYEAGKTYEAHIKEELEQDILTTVLLYREAVAEKLTLDQQTQDAVAEDVQAFQTYYSEETMKARNVSQDMVHKVYEMKYMADAYLATQQDETERDSGQERYVKVCQVLFPTVEFDDMHMVVTDTDGQPQALSQEKQDKAKEAAQELSQEAGNAKELQSQYTSYDRDAFCVEQYYKYADMEEAYQKAVDRTSEGAVGKVVPTTYGYVVFALLEKDASEYADLLEEHAQTTQEQAKRSEEMQKLFDRYVGDDKEYCNQERWDALKLADMIR